MNLSKQIESNQDEIHEDLSELIEKYKKTEYLKPYSKHTVEAFRKYFDTYEELPMILDLGCGTGESTIELAHMYPKYRILGIDKSEVRLSKTFDPPKNADFIRADIIDFVRLMKNEGRNTELTCLFYPNPWPKKDQLRKRIHAHPFFGDLLKISKAFTTRTNWKILALETKFTIEKYTNRPADFKQLIDHQEIPLTKFERKYRASNHQIYEVNFDTDFSSRRNG